MAGRAGATSGRRSRGRRRLGRAVGWAALVVALAGLGGSLLYLRTFPPIATVMSSSMEPAIGVGDVVVLRSLDGPPRVGEVVRFHVGYEARQKAGYPSSVIHRVVTVDLAERTITTKGDRMANPDPFTIPFDAVDARVALRIPYAGRLLGFFVSPFGLLWLAIGVLLLVILPFYDLHRERTELEELEVTAIGELGEKIEQLEGAESRAHLVPEVVVAPADDEVKETLRELVAAVREYGEHLRTHTAILRSMSEASRDLAAVAAELRGPRLLAAPAPGWTPDLVSRLRETAPDGSGFASTAELAFGLAAPASEVDAALEGLVAAGVLDIDHRSPERFHYRLLA